MDDICLLLDELIFCVVLSTYISINDRKN